MIGWFGFGPERKTETVKRYSGWCPNCRYIGPANLCSCIWTIRKVAEGRGAEPDTVRNAKTIIDKVDHP